MRSLAYPAAHHITQRIVPPPIFTVLSVARAEAVFAVEVVVGLTVEPVGKLKRGVI